MSNDRSVEGTCSGWRMQASDMASDEFDHYRCHRPRPYLIVKDDFSYSNFLTNHLPSLQK